MKILFNLILLLFLFPNAEAQILKRLKDKVVNKGKQEVSDAKYTAKQKAKETLRNELNDFTADFDSTDLDYAILLSDNSGLFGTRGRGEFGAKFIRLTGIARSLYKDLDLTNEENARLNLQMGQSGYAMGKYVFAEKRFRTAQRYFEQSGMTGDLGYLKTISGQGLLFASMGRFKQAEIFTRKALDMRLNGFGEKDMGVAASYNNCAVLNYNLGRYNESEKEFASATKVIEINGQKTSSAYAILLNNEAILYQSLGRYEAAEKNLKAAIAVLEQNEVSKARNHLKFYSNLALLYQQMGKYAQAREIYTRLEEKLEKGKPEFANMLNNVAILLLVMEKYEKIEELLNRSAEIYRSTLGENSPAYAKVRSDLGNYYRYTKKYAEAEPILQQVLQIRENSLGPDHPLFVQSQEDLAILYWKKGEIAKTIPLYREVMEKSLEFINRYFPPMSESEKTKYWDILAPRFQRFYNFAIEASGSDESVMADLFTYRLATKGLLLNSARKVNESILASNNERLIQDYLNWIDNKEQLASLYAYSKQELGEQDINIDSLESAANAMEKRLSEQSRDFAQYYYTSRISYEQVQQKLKDDEALVEMICIRRYEETFSDSTIYLSLIVTREKNKPEYVLLKNGFELENTLFKNWRKSVIARVNDERTYNYYWKDVDAKLKGKSKVYFSPDGIYNQMNLYSFKKPGGDYLIHNFQVSLISNPKYLLYANNTVNKIMFKKATLVGFPVYGAKTIPELPATKKEIEEIDTLLQSSGYEVSTFLQKDASENNLKSAKEPSVLHIATHGYFLKDVQRAVWPVGVHADYAQDNVLLRSGLILAGALEADKDNLALSNISNGVVTSYEAMNLDLQGTDLVVLSACETGLGEVKAGEGVYGLQRAFLVAGARTLIMSLWKVNDAATQELMNNFYIGWTKTGGMQQAFREAQLQLMKKYKDPFFWAAFVMMED
ncbi:MAG TPA: CHAT domain-containing protein [Chitinophagaceae bacterium]|nr:CHAT domain-containing protein [Chitinophagaceae bacterium]